MTESRSTRILFSRRSVLGMLGTAGVVAAVPGCGSSLGGGGDAGGGGQGGAVKVGLVIPQAGVYAPLGVDMQRGWELYLNQHDGRLGDREVTTVVADEGEGPESGVPAVQRVLQRDRVDVVVGIVNSAVALGAVDAVTSAGKLLVVSNAGAGALTGENRNPLTWRTSFANAQVSSALGDHLAGQNLPGGVYLIAPDYAAGEEALGGFREAFEAGGGRIAGEARTPFGTTQDFQPFLAGIRSSGAAATFCFYAGGEAVSFVQQYDSFGLKQTIPLFGSGFLTEGGVLDAQGAAATGVQTSLHYTTELDNPANTAFIDSYTAANGAAPTVYSVQTYDAAAVLDRAIGQAGDVAGTALSEAMGSLGTIEDSPRGPWTFDGQNPRQTYYLREVRRQGQGYVNAVVADLGEFAQPA
ncbi:MAG: ABC transporter substrate-binding protein [Pseudonocardiaceae bacterium]|nr:ABC transporter substrate-binding protein [Pseudonocardiaceae bacterium]